MTRSLLLALVAGACGLTACASFDGLAPKARLNDPASLAANQSLSAVPAAPANWPADDWWQGYGDPQLDALMAEAIAGSPNLRIAQARVDAARAQVAAADSTRLPRLDAAGQVDRQRYSENGFYPPPVAGATLDSGQLGLDFSYAFDFWGRQSAALAAATSRAQAAEVDAQAARLTLTTAIARTYVELDHQFALRDIAESTQKQREEIRRLTGLRAGAGLESQVALKQSAAAVHAAAIEIAIADERIALLRNALAALLGQGPDRGLAIHRPTLGDGPAAALPSQLPADLLGRRPDVTTQRLLVEAAGHDIDSAKASFYPNVNLTAMLGFQAVGLDKLLEQGSRIGGIGLALSLPIFDGGRLRANLAARDAGYDLAVEQYNAALVAGLRDVVDQIRSWRAIERQSGEQQLAQHEAEAAYRMVTLRYREGLANYLGVLSAETQVLEQRRLAADLRGRRLATSIELTRALGGGFNPDADTHATSPGNPT